MKESAPARKFRVLFLCTGNSARSILAEYFLRRLDPARFESFSAGANPRGHVNRHVLELLKDEYDIDASEARSKSWDEYRDVKFDFVITVCDKARESCPVWPGQPIVAHWSFRDPDGVEGTEEQKRQTTQPVAVEIYRRLGFSPLS
jgi:protein-tyrosine-phosphatase